jgi:hypothetical protein
MSLPWVRLDSNIYTHDKITLLLAQREGWRAYAVYTFSLAFAGGHATDGFIPRHVLPILRGTDKHAQMLVEHRLWEYAEGGWRIHNWEHRQELAFISETKRRNKSLAGKKSQCVQRHGPDCGCWKEEVA